MISTTAVLDTNVVVSALMRDTGIPSGIMALAFQGSIELCVSVELFAEYEEVIRRPRLKIPGAQALALLNWFQTHARWVTPTETLVACSDPDDNMVLACALQGDVDFLVTGNGMDFPRRFDKIAVVTPRQFIDALRAH